MRRSRPGAFEAPARGAALRLRPPRRGDSESDELPAIRAEFRHCLSDVHGESVQDLLKSIQRSRNAKDLWHLRTWLYTEVAKAHSQYEAERRLSRLAPHFPQQAAKAMTGKAERAR